MNWLGGIIQMVVHPMRPARSGLTAFVLGLLVATLAVVPASVAGADETGHSISGHVSSVENPAPYGVKVSIVVYSMDSPSSAYAWNESDQSGNYAVTGLPDGDYQVRFHAVPGNPPTDGPGYAATWFGPAIFQVDAQVITLAGADVRADVEMAIGGSITGTIKAPWIQDERGTAAWAHLIGPDGTVADLFYGESDVSGFYRIPGLPTGSYLIKFGDPAGVGGNPIYGDEYWQGVVDPQRGRLVPVTAGSEVSGYNATLSAWEARVIDRLDGPDRFAAAATMSRETFTPGVPIVMIANGLNFPDALSAGPAAGKLGGPVLLVTPRSIPEVVATELRRLRPLKIVVVGGPVSVTDPVLRQLADYAPQTERISGADRFEVSRNVAYYARQDRTGNGQPTLTFSSEVFFADGRGFADALSAGGAAALSGGVVVLVNGGDAGIDPATTQLLADIDPTHVWMIGGPRSLNDSLQRSIAAAGYSTQRLGGADRYAVSAEVGRYFGGTTDLAFFAVGTNFPDALAGSAIAGAYRAGMYIVPPNCVPAAVLARLRFWNNPNVVLLGGPASLGAGVEALKPC